MGTVEVQANYYEQFDADFNLDVPAEGCGGWKKAGIEIAVERTALVMMHAWDIGTYEEYPGWFRACEEVPRTYEICRKVFPRLLSAVRASEMPLFHVVGGGDYYKGYAGYRRAVELAGPEPPRPERVEVDPVLQKLHQFRSDHVWVGAHNQADYRRGSSKRDFAKEAVPMGEEGVAENGHQLFALCREAGVNHLIYAGFDINMCLMFSPGGMAEMQQRGVLCSAIREAVTAGENKETAREELCKEIALWYVALNFGFVFDLEDLLQGIGQS
ncbi:MAG: hypothetical protein O2954_17920 [bacterium]|nr:hypothetical protein [bacterium]